MELNLIHKNNLFKIHLSTLSGVKFTSREIDIISCIIKNRAEKKIARMLDISPRTVSSHVHNIMSKVGCNSKDQIIDLIEKSGKLRQLSKYYQTIVIDSYFRSILEKISKLLNLQENSGVFINDVCTKNKSTIKILAAHLKMAGLNLSCDSKHKDNILRTSIGEININNRSYFQLIFKLILKLDNSDEIKKIEREFFKEIKNLTDEYVDTTNLIKANHNRRSIYSLTTKSIVATILIISTLAITIFFIKNAPEDKLKKYNFEPLNLKNTSYLYRGNLIDKLDEIFKNNNRVNIAVVSGPGGAGKTFLSKYYGVIKNFNLVWLCNVEGDTGIMQSLEQLALELSETQEDKLLLVNISQRDKVLKRRNLMHFIQKKLQNIGKWLVIFDNVHSYSDIRDFKNHDNSEWGQGSIIINTTNRTLHNSMDDFPRVKTIEIPELTEHEKMHLFCNALKGSSFINCGQSKIKNFLEHLPSFPLDVTIAANYLKQERIGIDKYLEYLRNNEKEFIFTQQDIIQEITNYHKTRYDIISLSVKQILEEREEKYLDFLLIASMIHNNNIDIDFLLGLHNEVLVREFLNSMQKYSMIIEEVKDSDGLTQYFSLHRYTQNMILSYLKTRYDEETLNNKIALIANSFKKYLVDIQLSKKCKDLKSVIFHLEVFLNNIPDQSDSTFIEIHKIIGDFYYHLGSYDLAERKIHNVYNTYLNTLGEKHIKTILTQGLLATIYRNAGKYHSARRLFENGLKNIKNNPQANQQDVAWIMKFLGSVYRNTGQFEESMDIISEALKKYKADPESTIANIISCKLYLATTYQVMGQNDIAEKLLSEVLDYHSTNATYNISKPIWVRGRLAKLYLDTMRINQAEAIFKDNLQFYTENFSRESLESAWVIVQLGKVYYSSDRLDLAENNFKEALEIYRKKHSDLHNVTFGWVYYHMGILQIKKKDFDKAKQYLSQSKMIYSKFYGRDHVKTVKVKSKISELNELMSKV